MKGRKRFEDHRANNGRDAVDAFTKHFSRKITWKRETCRAEYDNPGIKRPGFHQSYKNLRTVTYTIFHFPFPRARLGERRQAMTREIPSESFIKERASLIALGAPTSLCFLLDIVLVT